MKNNPWDEIEDSTNKIDFNAIIADKESVLDFYWAKDYYGHLLFVLHTNSDIIINEKIPNLKFINQRNNFSVKPNTTISMKELQELVEFDTNKEDLEFAIS